MLDQLTNQYGRKAAAENERVPMSFVHVITRLDVFVTISQFQSALGITLQVDPMRMLVGHSKSEHLAAYFINKHIRPEGSGLLGTGKR